MHRFFADERGVVQGAAYLNAEDAGHALRVLRLESGDEVELVCAPARYRATIDSTEGGEVRLRVIEKLRDTEARTRVTLYQGLPKADKMELIVQKSTELGAAAIAPVAMIRSVVRLEGKDAEKKTERWQKIAREAVKQCARVSAPEVRLPRKLSASCGTCVRYEADTPNLLKMDGDVELVVRVAGPDEYETLLENR